MPPHCRELSGTLKGGVGLEMAVVFRDFLKMIKL